MKIGFLGAPGSGKTTTAALVFARLKDNGISCEFIPEQARLYIAKKRVDEGLLPTDQIELGDLDQIQIMAEQHKLESIMRKACGKKIRLISDSSTYNALLYMNPSVWDAPEVVRLLEKSRYDILFYSTIFSEKRKNHFDPNRVHSSEQSVEIDSKILTIAEHVKKYVPDLELINLCGSSEDRATTVLSHMWRKE